MAQKADRTLQQQRHPQQAQQKPSTATSSTRLRSPVGKPQSFAPSPGRSARESTSAKAATTGKGGVDASNPVLAFLIECGLQMYALPLLQNGFDDMETIADIQ